jgi:N-carbamoyl-L-amino-acid hydrolase
LRRSIEVVAWTNEEGSRFAPGMMGSEAFTGLRSLDSILAVRDAQGVSVRDALPALMAATPQARQRPLGFPLAAYVEAHIEQGPLLEEAGCPVGVVRGIQGVRRYRVEVFGEEAHAGTTSRRQRKDALMATAHMMVALERAVMPFEDDVRFTVAMVKPSPNVPSVVAGHVLFSIDLRHPDDEILKTLGDRFPELCRQQARGCSLEIREIAAARSVRFPSSMVETIRGAAERVGIRHMDIDSGAGHDARQLHHHCPSAMIFVPCERGVSHKETENAKPSDLAAGARVLTEALLELAG